MKTAKYWLAKALEQDPMSFWDGKKIDDIVTTRVISVDKKGLLVKPEGSDLEIFIKKPNSYRKC